jgi:hypothetical protein
VKAARRRRSRRLQRALGRLRALPLALQIGAGAILVIALAFAGNWAYQVVRKPTELFFPVSGALDKTPAQTWRE